MKRYKQALIVLFFSTSLFANNINSLYEQALEYEKNQQYKEAMEIYKKIANLNKPQKKIEESISFKQTKKDSNTKKDFTSLKSKFFNKYLDKIEDKETSNTLEQVIIRDFGLYPYKTTYLLPVTYDTKEKDNRSQYETKFQLSFEKPLTYNIFGLNETISFAYTQKSYWQTSRESAPFRESNYQPEFFVTIPYKNDNSSLKGYKISFLHESNGQAEEKSRSWNRVYLESYFQYSNLFLIPRIWYRIPEKTSNDDNKDIEKYLGFGDLTFFYPYKKHTFELKLRNNLRLNKDNKGAVEFNWSFPLPSFLNIANSFGYFQVFSGYGDSLIDYDKEINKIGLGIAFTR
ncbi:phospholipase A [Malaciobacter mytili]|uniref:phospholipase A n=1 Tax=Malaciobacter mytili TaxID=603050 RepID=UPI003A83B411